MATTNPGKPEEFFLSSVHFVGFVANYIYIATASKVSK